MAKRKEMRNKASRRNGYESGVLSTVEKKLGVNASGSEMVSRDDAIVASSSSLMKGIEGGKVGGGGGAAAAQDEEDNAGGGGFALGGTGMKLQPAKDKFAHQVKEQVRFRSEATKTETVLTS